VLTFAVLLFLLGYILVTGIPHLKPSLFQWNYTSENVSMMPAILTTVETTALALLLAVPLGLLDWRQGEAAGTDGAYFYAPPDWLAAADAEDVLLHSVLHAMLELLAGFAAGNFHRLARQPPAEKLVLLELGGAFAVPFAEIALRQSVHHLRVAAGIQHLQRLTTAGQRTGEKPRSARIVVLLFHRQQLHQPFGRQRFIRAPDITPVVVRLGLAVPDQMDGVALHQKHLFTNR